LKTKIGINQGNSFGTDGVNKSEYVLPCIVEAVNQRTLRVVGTEKESKEPQSVTSMRASSTDYLCSTYRSDKDKHAKHKDESNEKGKAEHGHLLTRIILTNRFILNWVTLIQERRGIL